MKLIQELYGQGIISDKQKKDLEDQVAKSQKTEEEVIVQQKIVEEDFLFKLKSKITQKPLYHPGLEKIPSEVLELIGQEASINYKMAPLFRRGKTIGIGMVYPENILAQNALRFLNRKENYNYEVYLITFTDLNNILRQQRTLTNETKRALTQMGKDEFEIKGPKIQESVRVTDDAPIIKMVMVILRHAIEGSASDIHIEPGREKLNIRFRQDGILHLSLFLPLSVHLAIVSRIKILSNLKIDENRVPQDGRFSAKINDKDIDFRVATFPTLYGEKVEIRVLDPAEGLKSFEKMGLEGRNFEIIQQAIKKPYGLVLSSGPTGSGKTTTLYAIMRILNKESVNIVTIEDPIEYSIDGLNQSQIKPEIGYTFAEGLRQILRQDPNIIMVGEIRDEETANLAIHASLTGHVVLSTLHTNSAAGVVPRLIDMGIRPFLIPSTLRVAISQRLIRTLCEKCKKKVKINDKAKKYIADVLKSMPSFVKKETAPPQFLYEANGCEQCNLKGYAGRIGIFEVMSMTDELADVISKNPAENAIFKVAQSQGMLTMVQEGVLKVLKGETTVSEITRATEEK